MNRLHVNSNLNLNFNVPVTECIRAFIIGAIFLLRAFKSKDTLFGAAIVALPVLLASDAVECRSSSPSTALALPGTQHPFRLVGMDSLVRRQWGGAVGMRLATASRKT